MKKIIVNSSEIDVSNMSNSDIYKLVSELGKTNAVVEAVDTEANFDKALVARTETTSHYKCYGPKFSVKVVERWKTGPYKELKEGLNTNKISKATNKKPSVSEVEYEGIGMTSYARSFFKPGFSVGGAIFTAKNEVEERALQWASQEAERQGLDFREDV